MHPPARQTESRLLGRFEARPGGGGRIQPIDRPVKAEWRVPPGEAASAESGEIVLARPLPYRGLGLRPARVIERLGPLGDARSVSLVCICSNDIPTDFSPEALADAERAEAVPFGGREDLRELPLVTIDGPDARDFDDAVWAAPESGGFRLLIAVADVAHYVTSGGSLDRDARLRGNSVYFPDQVVPMLPEALSNGWCSLQPGAERGCLFAEIHIDAEGRSIGHRFGRGLMRSAARLTYEAVQAAQDAGDGLSLGEGLAHLYAAFRTLHKARQARGTLDLNLPERQVILHDGKVHSVRARPRLDSHRLIEELMIAANVAAAETLERTRQPCLYRVHAPPSDAKLQALRTVLHGLGIGLPAGNQIHPGDLEGVLRRAAGTSDEGLVNEIILRSQSQAEYALDNIGHFGLALPRYAHFTSPIRRYADLIVHRALITGLQLGADGVAGNTDLADVAQHVTATERRATLAERDAVDRHLAAFMADQVGNTFAARVSGVQRFGIFVTLAENGASGLVPVRSLPDDVWLYDEPTQSLSGRHTRLSFRLAQHLDVRLAATDLLTGMMTFESAAAESAARRRVRRR